ncbi:ATP-binding protein [Frondihabitans peucedani]|uniref:Histidine kinase/HSP90-like ATPase domain-containing protein n=1 Tax=Frondihabitans peucedani TaxID=598626 RepID=A0ABP8E621_9MICO
MGRAFAAACLVFGAQTLPFALRSPETMNPTWAWTVGLVLYGVLALCVVTGALARYVRPAAIALSAVFLVIVATWPFAAVDLGAILPTQPWPWYLVNVATGAAAIVLSAVVATGYALVLTTVYLLVRLTPPGGAATAEAAALESGYALILGLGTVLLIAVVRRSAASVDAAAAAAVDKYATATKDHSLEVERNEVDALLHDSVMAALLAGSRAFTPTERRYAVGLARTSLDVIADTSGSSGTDSVPLTEVGARFSAMCVELGLEASLSATGVDGATVPRAVADAFFAAALQALMNSAQHAGTDRVRRTVTAAWDDARLTVVLADDGVGFDPSRPTARLGIQKSIVGRLESIGGTAAVDSAPGRGTVVTLTWSAQGSGPAAPADPAPRGVRAEG